MVEIEFNYNQRITSIYNELDHQFKTAIRKYIQKTSIEEDSLYFVHNGKKIDNIENKIEDIMSEIDIKNKKMPVLVYKCIEENKKEVIIKSKDIICPQCQEPCRIKMKDYKIKLYECINDHITNNIDIIEFEDTQNINISNIICDVCKNNNKGNCQNNEFYYCITCKKNICLLCIQNHSFNHHFIRYDEKNYMCILHNEKISKYCKHCKKNICFFCYSSQEHNNHKN